MRLGHVDALRGFAALYVVAFHLLFLPPEKPAVDEWLRPLLVNGWSGVQLFFVISAFTLCLTSEKARDSRNWIRAFYVKRVFRILPLYFTWMILYIALDRGFLTHPIGTLRYVYNHLGELLLYFSLLFNFVPGKHEGLVAASWTLSVEMLFYAVFPFIFLKIRSVRGSLVFVALSVGVSVVNRRLLMDVFGQNDDYVYFSILNQLPAFALGMLAYFLIRHVQNDLQQDPGVRLLFRSILILCALAFIVEPYYLAPKTPGSLIVMSCIYAGMLVSLSVCTPRWIASPAPAFLGTISYSLYLNHPKLILALSPAYLWATGLLGRSILGYFTCLGMTCCILVMISWLTYRYIEKPGMEWGSRVAKRAACAGLRETRME